MIDMLMYISNGLIVFGFIGYLLLILINKNKKITDSDGFNITKDILHEYDSINIIETKSLFTVYNIKRKVIKISSFCYYGKCTSDIAIPLIESGISVVDNNKNKFIKMVRSVISNLKILYILPIIALLINSVTFQITDARIGIMLLATFLLINYVLMGIKTTAVAWVNDNIKKVKSIKKENIIFINKFLNMVLLCDKFIFFGEIVMIIRFVAILLEFNF